jgi:hypothetical protein
MLEKRSSFEWGRKSIGIEWMVNWTSLGAGLNWHQGELPTRYDLFKILVRGAK